MTNSTWLVTPLFSNNYTDAANWSLGEAGPSDAAFFGMSTRTSLSIDTSTVVEVGEWIFNPGAAQYSFTIGVSKSTVMKFTSGGMIVNGGSVNISINFSSSIDFYNNGTAGTASITISISGLIDFLNGSTAGNANITSSHDVVFEDESSAGNATIHMLASSFTVTQFLGFSTGGNAQLNTDPGTIVDFSQSAGPRGDHKLTAGSIAGAGTYRLGADQLTVGSDGRSTIVSGPVDDGGFAAGSGASLVKVGHDTLTLSGAGNTYSGGTTIEQGTLNLAALGAAGPSAIAFAGRATLEIENAALSGHAFGNLIELFGKHDVLDLAGLRFHPGARATYHKASHHLTVHSGHVTDTLTLFSPHETHFTAANDGHGGTKVTLEQLPGGGSLPAASEIAPVAGDHAASHTVDYLFAA
jgi:autotransporter-associated beta strand protein